MKIQIVDPKENTNIKFYVPLGLVFNRLTCLLLAKSANQYTNGIELTSQQLYELMKCLKESKKIFGHYDLVSVESSDGEIVNIRI